MTSKAQEVLNLIEGKLKSPPLPSLKDFNNWWSELKKAGASSKQLAKFTKLTDGLLDLFSEVEGSLKK